MNDSIYRVCLDIHTIASQLMLDIKENDVGRRIVFTLTEAGKPYELTSDCSAVFRAKKPDGTVLYNGCVMRGNIIEYTLTAQTSAAVGILECELTIYGANNKQITSPRFEMRVEGNVATDSEIESQDEFTALNEAINECENLDIVATKEDNITTILITKKDGTVEEVEILDGEKGDPGDKGDPGEVSEAELNVVRGDLLEVEQTVAQHSSHIEDHGELISGIQSDVSEISEKQITDEQSIAVLNSTVAGHSTSIESIESSLASQEQILSAHTVWLNNLSSKKYEGFSLSLYIVEGRGAMVFKSDGTQETYTESTDDIPNVIAVVPTSGGSVSLTSGYTFQTGTVRNGATTVINAGYFLLSDCSIRIMN